MGLRKAEGLDVRRFEDGEDWLELRQELTKGQRNRIVELTQSYRLPVEGGEEAGIEMKSRFAEVQRALFEFLAVGWSLGSGKPTAADYEALDDESGEWVDDCMDTVLRERRERAEGNAIASETPGPSQEQQSAEAASE